MSLAVPSLQHIQVFVDSSWLSMTLLFTEIMHVSRHVLVLLYYKFGDTTIWDNHLFEGKNIIEDGSVVANNTHN